MIGKYKSRKGGFIIEVFVLFIILGIILGFFIFYMLIAAGIAELKVNVKTTIELPSVSQISSNSFLKLTSNCPEDNNLMRNLMSMYVNSGDDTNLHNAISTKKAEMFAVVDDDNVMLKIGDYKFNGGLMGWRNTAFRRIAFPEGNFEEIQMRFYVRK